MKFKSIFSEYLQIALGIFFASFGLKAFLLPNGFLDGGATGIALLIGQFTSIEISYVLPVVSIPFLILGWYTLSKITVIKSTISIGILAIVIHFENFDAITDEKLLIAIFGGIFLGAGIGLGIKNGAVLDGSEILGIYLNDRLGIPIGTIILMFNTILFGITAIILSVEIALYSTLAFIVTGKVIDFVFEGFEDYVNLMIVSKESEKIREALLHKAQVGMTVIKGGIGYGSSGETNNLEVIHTVLNRINSKKIYKIINKIDENAFVMEIDVNNVKGGVLRKYLDKSKERQLSPSLYKTIKHEK